MSDVERLNYVNGRRLGAGDLRLEQGYHIGMRRRLNRGLFTAGIVNGFAITQASTTEVYVEPGLALDPRGNEVVKTQLETVRVPAQLPTSNAGGYFLVARYDEQGIAGTDPDCGPPLSEAARIREEPVLEWTERPPWHVACHKGIGEPFDCGVVLGLVRLTPACEIELVDVTSRELASPVNSSRATAFALEGEKDIDAANPKVLHFQVRGGAPTAAVLYLWGARFSSLYYTELGDHRHGFGARTGPATTTLAAHTHTIDHAHPIPAVTTGGAGGHGHDLWVDKAGGPGGREGTIATHNGGSATNAEYVPRGGLGDLYVRPVGDHAHDVVLGGTGGPDTPRTGPASPDSQQGTETHDHAIPDTLDSGVDDIAARTGGVQAHTFPSDVHVDLDGADITAEILRVLPNTWGQLGDGGGGHEFVLNGTGPIDLIDAARAVGETLDVGTHTLTFSVAAGGGKVLYNLVVE
jgi:hypothetical protein